MKRILFVIFLFSSALLFAQKQSLDTSLIRIGEQTKININCNFEKEESFAWPNFNDTLITGIEIIEKGEIKALIPGANSSIPRQELPEVYELNGAIYLSETKGLIESRNFFTKPCIPYKMPEYRSVNINNKRDLDYAKALLVEKI